MEIVLSAVLENFATKHAVKIVKTDVTKTLAAARKAVYLVTLEIFVTKRAMIDVYLVVNQELTTVSMDFYLEKKNNAKMKTYLLFFILPRWGLTTKNVSILQLNRRRIHAPKTFPF